MTVQSAVVVNCRVMDNECLNKTAMVAGWLWATTTNSDIGGQVLEFLIMSLLVTLCLERISPVNLIGSATDSYVAIMPERISSNEARIVWDASIER